ncbi:MAG: septum formation initiator family protein [Actinomycetota bacterium]|jgi:cell division protein FtsB|nr:septum formation initiator family protein [Actinomycetota bacterium]
MTAPSRRAAELRRASSRSVGGLRQATSGDRPYVVGLFVLIAVLAITLVAPVRSLTSAADRADELSAQRELLVERVDELERRRERLRDPLQIELLAREQLGMVRPGEIPYVVARPQGDGERLELDGRATLASDSVPWYRRLGAAFGQLFR